jgi:hypothetical protein
MQEIDSLLIFYYFSLLTILNRTTTVKMICAEDIEKVERLIRLSETNAVLPDVFVPWHIPEDNEPLMPEEIISLQGHPLFDTLSATQKRELGRHELVQVMYSYAWAEGLACFIFNKRLLKIPPDSVEYRYLVKELIEEFRHQDMFAKAIRLLNGKKIQLSWFSSFHWPLPQQVYAGFVAVYFGIGR